MKKIFFLTCLMLSAALTFAQETKKVAILEVVDKEGNISYANKLILRSNLAKAVTNTPGYEAYDRTDMDAILGEQNFQRTGMVSNDQIKQLGEMTGAKFVLVAEAAVVDANTMYITAKLLDVETARTEITDNQMMGNSAKEIQRGCQLLAEKLIKPVVISKTGHSSAEKASKEEKAAKAEESSEKQQAKADKKNSKKDKRDEALIASMEPLQTVSVDEKPSAAIPQLIKISNNEYRLGETKMDRKAYQNFLYENCPQAWKKHKNGKNAIITGWIFFTLGAAATVGGGVLYASSEKKYDLYWENRRKAEMCPVNSKTYNDYMAWADYYYDWYRSQKIWGLSLMCGGGGLAGLGLITFSAGYGSKAAALKTYNKKCATATPITLNLISGYNGLGLALQF